MWCPHVTKQPSAQPFVLQQLKGKVLVKGKKLPELQPESCGVTSILDEEEEEETEEEDRLQVVNFLVSPSPRGH